MNYPGTVPRQELVDYCKKLADVAVTELDREQTFLEKNKHISDDQYETILLSCSALSGEIAALRAVTEWARKWVEQRGELD